VVGEHKGFTESHQVLIRPKALRARKGALLLEKANIFANKMELIRANGLRVGVSEVTRTGMREHDMAQIARLFRQFLLDRKSPQWSRWRREVARL
jgi:glycine/serine hydroxymethyltransferase